MIAQYMGFYTPERLDALFEGFGYMNAKFTFNRIALDMEFVCDIIGKDTSFPKVSFFRHPFDYLFDKTGERAYKGAVKSLIDNLNGEKFEKEITFAFLKNYKEAGA